MSWRGVAACVLKVALVMGGAVVAAPSAIEADWLAQNRLRGATHPSAVAPTTADDARGGCDGVRNGSYGFHTGASDKPSWWQVDLGASHAIARIVIYNRCDFPIAPVPQPTAKLQVMLSNDGEAWRSVYAHDGSAFYGQTDGKPLILSLNAATGRFIRFQVPPRSYLHFDEVEVYGPGEDTKNLALDQPADQSSLSQWSTRKKPAVDRAEPTWRISEVIERGRRLAADLRSRGVAVETALAELTTVEQAIRPLTPDRSDQQRELYLKARSAVRRLALTNPTIDFDSVLFVKRALSSFSHMSDQYYSWFSRLGGGVYVLQGIKSDAPTLRCLTEQFATGSFLSPDLSPDGRKILFSYSRHYPGRDKLANKLDKSAQPEDSFFHIFEISVDGSNLRQLTHGRYDDFFARYLPSGEIVFLTTRRGQFVQCGKASAAATTVLTLPDSFVRCGGDASRPVSVYTLHVMDQAGQNLRAISPFENFEWDPSVGADGRILYARWDYVDRDNMPYMKLWATNTDGTNPQAVWGNYTRNPQCAFEPRSVPNSHKIVFTAAAHHAITGGSLVLLDPLRGEVDGMGAITRLTPEVVFPESEGWSEAYFANPYPLSETYYLTAWGAPLQPGCPPQAQHWGQTGPTNALGIYLFDAFGNLELLHRDPELSSMYPIPIRSRIPAPAVATGVDWDGKQFGTLMLLDVYAGLGGVQRGSVKQLRVVAMPAKVQPTMNTPKLGVTGDDPGKCVLGTVPVEADGSAHFRVPSGVALFFQALDEEGRAIQTMRSLTYVQPGQTMSCIGCHEDRATPPLATGRPMAAMRSPSKIKLGPEGSWPLRFDGLVQGILDRHCTTCHRPDADDASARKFDLTAAKAWDTLIAYGKPSLRDEIRQSYARGKSVANAGPSHISPLLKLLTAKDGHAGIKLDADSYERLVTWMDTYGQLQGSYSDEQEEQLRQLRARMAEILE